MQFSQRPENNGVKEASIKKQKRRENRMTRGWRKINCFDAQVDRLNDVHSAKERLDKIYLK